MDYVLLASAVLLTSLSQVLQKLGVQRAGSTASTTFFPRPALARVETRLGVLALAAATLLWLVVLTRVDVGKAYPCLSFGYVVVLVVSRYFFGEQITRTRWLGVAMILSGIALVTQS